MLENLQNTFPSALQPYTLTIRMWFITNFNPRSKIVRKDTNLTWVASPRWYPRSGTMLSSKTLLFVMGFCRGVCAFPVIVFLLVFFPVKVLSWSFVFYFFWSFLNQPVYFRNRTFRMRINITSNYMKSWSNVKNKNHYFAFLNVKTCSQCVLRW